MDPKRLCKKEHCLYLKSSEFKRVKHSLIVCVYVDNLTITGSHLSSITYLKTLLSAKFTMKDLGNLHYLLKMEIKRNLERKTLCLSQQKHIQDLLEKFELRGCKVAPIPQARSVVLEKKETLTPEQIAAQPFGYRD
ncbi:reverse transcriptase [Phytophthora megakarya]|uniref:Reverse transcriptase n=1 Tax=Phytophthora megakarya TaxID=4795 RepID=A0A225UDF9_9STRA|nr:reverse transcriptase [Phytophthora megakarya]